MRHLAGPGDYPWTNLTLTPDFSPVAADDVRDLRTALNAALTALHIPLPAYNPDPTIYNGQNGQRTTIKRDHIRQLREAATRGLGAASGGWQRDAPARGRA